MASHHKIKAAIFDVDGLLLDTEKCFDTVMAEIAGRPVPPATRNKMFGRKSTESAQIFVTEMDLDLTPEDYLTKRKPRLEELFAQTSLMPGAASIIHYFANHNIPLAIATSSHRQALAIKFSIHPNLLKLFPVIITGDDVTNGKPNPEIFLLAASKLKLHPAHCLVFEDAANGVAAAIAGAFPVIGVANPKYITPADLPDAAQVLTSLEQFDPASWNLPLS